MNMMNPRFHYHFELPPFGSSYVQHWFEQLEHGIVVTKFDERE